MLLPLGGNRPLTRRPSQTGDYPMGHCAEETASKHNITRADQDKFALESYRRSAVCCPLSTIAQPNLLTPLCLSRSQAAWAKGAFNSEIIPHTIPDKRKGDTIISEDEEYKRITPSKVASLRPVFKKDGTITAANASTLNDGASAIVLASEEKVEELGLTPLARIVCTSSASSSLSLPLARVRADRQVKRSFRRRSMRTNRLSHRTNSRHPFSIKESQSNH